MSTARDRKNKREKCLHTNKGDDKKKVKSWNNTYKKKIKEDMKEAIANSDEHSQEEQNVIMENLKRLREDL